MEQERIAQRHRKPQPLIQVHRVRQRIPKMRKKGNNMIQLRCSLKTGDRTDVKRGISSPLSGKRLIIKMQQCYKRALSLSFFNEDILGFEKVKFNFILIMKINSI